MPSPRQMPQIRHRLYHHDEEHSAEEEEEGPCLNVSALPSEGLNAAQLVEVASDLIQAIRRDENATGCLVVEALSTPNRAGDAALTLPAPAGFASASGDVVATCSLVILDEGVKRLYSALGVSRWLFCRFFFLPLRKTPYSPMPHMPFPRCGQLDPSPAPHDHEEHEGEEHGEEIECFSVGDIFDEALGTTATAGISLGDISSLATTLLAMSLQSEVGFFFPARARRAMAQVLCWPLACSLTHTLSPQCTAPVPEQPEQFVKRLFTVYGTPTQGLTEANLTSLMQSLGLIPGASTAEESHDGHNHRRSTTTCLTPAAVVALFGYTFPLSEAEFSDVAVALVSMMQSGVCSASASSHDDHGHADKGTAYVLGKALTRLARARGGEGVKGSLV